MLLLLAVVVDWWWWLQAVAAACVSAFAGRLCFYFTELCVYACVW